MTINQISWFNNLFINKDISSLEHFILGLILMSEDQTYTKSYTELAQELKRDRKNVYQSVLDLKPYITNERVGHKRKLSLREEFKNVE